MREIVQIVVMQIGMTKIPMAESIVMVRMVDTIARMIGMVVFITKEIRRNIYFILLMINIISYIN